MSRHGLCDSTGRAVTPLSSVPQSVGRPRAGTEIPITGHQLRRRLRDPDAAKSGGGSESCAADRRGTEATTESKQDAGGQRPRGLLRFSRIHVQHSTRAKRKTVLGPRAFEEERTEVPRESAETDGTGPDAPKRPRRCRCPEPSDAGFLELLSTGNDSSNVSGSGRIPARQNDSMGPPQIRASAPPEEDGHGGLPGQDQRGTGEVEAGPPRSPHGPVICASRKLCAVKP